MSRGLLKMPKTIQVTFLEMFRTRIRTDQAHCLGTYNVILEGIANALDDRKGIQKDLKKKEQRAKANQMKSNSDK